MEIIFTPINTETWHRREVFWYFSQMAPTGYSLTVDVDITHMHSTLKKVGVPFYPAYLWLVTKELSRQPEFTTAVKDGKVGFYNSLTPMYAVFHDDDKTFSLMWTEYSEDFKEFYKSYKADNEKYRANHGILSKKDSLPPENAYTVSCLPWVNFKHFAVHSYENKPYYFPSVESGKFYEKEGRLFMPLSITCHHASTDGWHINQFLKSLQRNADRFEIFL